MQASNAGGTLKELFVTWWKVVTTGRNNAFELAEVTATTRLVAFLLHDF